jgi:hypothetical protein
MRMNINTCKFAGGGKADKYVCRKNRFRFGWVYHLLEIQDLRKQEIAFGRPGADTYHKHKRAMPLFLCTKRKRWRGE